MIGQKIVIRAITLKMADFVIGSWDFFVWSCSDRRAHDFTMSDFLGILFRPLKCIIFFYQYTWKQKYLFFYFLFHMKPQSSTHFSKFPHQRQKVRLEQLGFGLADDWLRKHWRKKRGVIYRTVLRNPAAYLWGCVLWTNKNSFIHQMYLI